MVLRGAKLPAVCSMTTLLLCCMLFLEPAAGMLSRGTATHTAPSSSSVRGSPASVSYRPVPASPPTAAPVEPDVSRQTPGHPRVRSVDIVEPPRETGVFHPLAPLNDDLLDGCLMAKRRAKYGMCMTRFCYLAALSMLLGPGSTFFEQLTGHKQTTYIMADGANWWRLAFPGTVTLWREGSVLTAQEMGMGVGSSNGVEPRSGGESDATQVLEEISVLELVYQQEEFLNVPTLRFLDADVKTLQDVGASLGADGFASRDSCFAGELVAKTGGWRSAWVMPAVYHGGSAVGISTSVPTASCVLGETAFNPALAYRYGVASLVAVLEQAHLHEQLDKSKNYHDRPVASIETVAKTLGVFHTELYQNLPETLKTRASLLEFAKTGSPIFTKLNLAQFLLTMMLAHGTDPRGVGSNFYLRDYLRALVPEAYFAQVVHFLLPKLNLAARRYTKLTTGVEVRIRFPGGSPGGANSWIQNRTHMAPGYPFSLLEAESFFPNLVPNEIWASAVVESVDNNGRVPKVHLRVRKSCDEQRPGHDDDLGSAVPSKAVESDRFACPKIDPAQYPGVTLTGADGQAVMAGGITLHENMTVTISTEGRIAEMLRSPEEQHVAVLEDGPFAQLKQINSLDLERSVDERVNAGEDVKVGAGEMVLVDFLTKSATYNNGQHLLYHPDLTSFWGRITEQLHQGMERTQQTGSLLARTSASRIEEDDMRRRRHPSPHHRFLDGPGELWMKVWGIPYELASDSKGEILKLNIGDVDKAAAIAGAINLAIVGAVGFWGGSAEVMRLAARLGIELSLGMVIKGFAQDWMTRMDSSGYWICNDRMEIAGGDQGSSLQGMTWAKVAAEEHLGVQNIEQIKEGARRLENPNTQKGTLDQGTVQEIAALPASITTFRNCGDMAVSGHTNVVLFSRLFWVDFLHTSFAQQHILKNFFKLFFMMSAAGQWAVNGLGRRMRGKRSGEESLNNAWKWTLAELYWYEEKVTLQKNGSNSTRSLSRLDFIAKTWEGHLQYFRKVFHDTERKEKIRRTHRGPARWFEPGWRAQEIALRLQQKIKQTEKDIAVLRGVVEKLDAYFGISPADILVRSVEHGDLPAEGGQSARQHRIGEKLENLGLDVRRENAGGVWEDREIVTAIAGLLWKDDAGRGGHHHTATPSYSRVDIEGLGRKPTNDAARDELLLRELPSVGLLGEDGNTSPVDSSLEEDTESGRSSGTSMPSTAGTSHILSGDFGDIGLVQPSNISDWTFVRADKIAKSFWEEEDGEEGPMRLEPIYISEGASSTVESAGGSTTSDQFSTLHAAFLTATWSKYGAMFLRVTSFLLLQFFVVPSIITGEWYIIKSWFHWPRDTVESLLYAAVIKSVWWGVDLYANYRLTREMLILEEVGEARDREAQAARMDTARSGGVPAGASTATFARAGGSNNPANDLSYAGGRQVLPPNKLNCCPPEISNPNPIVAGARWFAERHARAAEVLRQPEEVCAEGDEETGTGSSASDAEQSGVREGCSRCAKAAGVRVWNSSLWAPVENDATGTLPGICVKDGLSFAAALVFSARIYIPLLMGDSFLVRMWSNGVLGTS